MRRASLPLVASLLLSTPGDAAPRILKRARAAQVVLAGEVIIALDRGFETITGYDRAGQRRWRTRYQKRGAARGTQALFVFGGRALLYGGDRAWSVDARSGRLGGKGARVPYLATPGVPGCWLNHVGGACAYYCPCNFHFARCDSGAFLGRSYNFHRVCKRNWNRPGSQCGCWGSDGDLIGRGSDKVLVAHMDRPSAGRGKRRTYGSILVGVESSSGKELWRRDAHVSSPATWINGLGLTAAGKTCWSGDSDGKLEVFTCRTGKLLWKRDLAQKVTFVGALKGGGIVIHGRRHVTCLEERTGKQRWRRPSAGVALALARGLVAPGRTQSVDGRGKLVTLDDLDGRTTGSVALRAKSTKVHFAGGQRLVLDGTRLLLLDPAGTPRARATLQQDAALTVGKDLLLARTRQRVEAFALPTLRRLGRVAGDLQVVAVEGGLGPRRALLYREDGERFQLLAF